MWEVHKFGGTSVGNALCMLKCVNIIRPLLTDKNKRIAMVVSAMGGKPKTTDLLLDLVHAAAARKHDEIANLMDIIREKHNLCLQSIFPDNPTLMETLVNLVEEDLKDIKDLLKAVELMRMAHEQILELVSGYGEVWCAQIMTQVMLREGLPFVYLNARDCLFVNENENTGTEVLWEESGKKLTEWIDRATIEYAKEHNGSTDFHLLITGYVASTPDGIATTLKRDGSDFSASIFGKLLKASTITIWTDVSGVYSADPRRVPDAKIIDDVSYTEAIELAYFGAKVIHPKTMAPAIDGKIPIYIRNTFKPHKRGTRIYLPIPIEGPLLKEKSVCGFTTIDNISLFNLEGKGMIGVQGIAHRLFGALHNGHISVMYISQASSEHSICFATKGINEAMVLKVVREAFYYEFKAKLVSDITLIGNCSIIAAVGENMKSFPGVSGLFFKALGDAFINVLSISQGCDERNIAAVVYSKDASRALRAVHSAFWLSSMDISIGIVGTGRVGSALIQNLIEQMAVLDKRFGLKMKIRGVANSRKMMLGDDILETLKTNMNQFVDTTLTRTSRARSIQSDTGLPPAFGSETSMAFEDGSCTPNGLSAINLEDASMSNSDDNDSGKGGMTPLMRPQVNVNRTSFENYPTYFEKSKTMSCVSLADLDTRINDNDDGSHTSPTDMRVFEEHIRAGLTPHSIIIDASNSCDVAGLHPKWLEWGSHVVTANKMAMAGPLELFNAVMTQSRLQNRTYACEAAIGASLPIRSTLLDIQHSGDALHCIMGMISVSINLTLTYICDENLSFSEAVVKTFKQGLFEDDAFMDLEGTETAMKLLILGRELGLPLEFKDIAVEPIAKRRDLKSWTNVGDAFAEEDRLLAERAERARKNGCTLRYVQRIECNPPVEMGNEDSVTVKCSIRLEEVPLNTIYASVRGAVYHFSFHTERYSQSPLIVQGPLSDCANTASAITGDILRIARLMGARDRGPGSGLLQKIPMQPRSPGGSPYLNSIEDDEAPPSF